VVPALLSSSSASIPRRYLASALNQGDLFQLGLPRSRGIRRHACQAPRRFSDQPWRFAIEASKNYIAVISQVNHLL
jgi:hypothetical protein